MGLLDAFLSVMFPFQKKIYIYIYLSPKMGAGESSAPPLPPSPLLKRNSVRLKRGGGGPAQFKDLGQEMQIHLG